MRRIVTIVEGHGEVEAVPVLLRRIAHQVAPAAALEVPRPIRVKRNRLLREGELERAVGLAAAKAEAHGCILILLDANGDCPAQLAPIVLRRAVAARRDRDIRVVLAKMEFEAWFLAAAASLAGRLGIDKEIAPPPDPEAIRDAKGWLSGKMPLGRPYRETLHQAALSATFDLDSAREAPSFDKLWREASSLIQAPEA